ncbi:hypothetical protein NLJ89_g1452 [Agrocybe chaxingu]|uniref:Tubulin beta chain n=1 Tax=Agrocybe chaxingu TaxID=84603 RepID=A0A9W8TED0_9AGAR|nr:hypothetical protein NLJ89_g1452 [Agrocybe chaxingu]
MPTSREIINVQVGQAGNQVGEAFWQMLLAEHGIDHSGVSIIFNVFRHVQGTRRLFTSVHSGPLQTYTGTDPLELQRAGTYFTEVTGASGNATRFVPRSVQVDLEAGVCNKLRSGVLGNLFRPDTYLSAESGAGNNWAKGYYTEGAELVDSILDIIRRQAEGCDALQGFQILHSLGGGTGAGLGSLMLSKLREEFPDRMMATFSILPSPKVSETVVEPYNALLSVHQLVDSSDLTICIDNEALYDICMRTLKVPAPNFENLNDRPPEAWNEFDSISPRKSLSCMNTLKLMSIQLHFLMPSYAPFYDPKAKHFEKNSVPELTKALFDRKNLLVACDPRFGRYLTAAIIFRGDISSREAEVAVHDLQLKNSQHFVEWIPDNVSVSLVSVPPVGQTQSATALSNSTAIQELFTRTLESFSAMFKRKAFLHWYTGEGMDIMEFSEAENNTRDLISEYQQYQEATVEEEEFGEEESAEEQ